MPHSSAVGRLFDAAAAMIGVCREASFEGQGPMQLEAICGKGGKALVLPVGRAGAGHLEWDWAPLIFMLLDGGSSASVRAAVFHQSLARLILELAQQARHAHGIQWVGLSGGVFQNRVLVEGVNLRWKNIRPTQQNPQGDRIQEECPIHASNVLLYDAETKKGTRKRKAEA